MQVYACNVMGMLCDLLQCGHSWVSLVVADGLVHIWQFDICNHTDDINCSAFI